MCVCVYLFVCVLAHVLPILLNDFCLVRMTDNDAACLIGTHSDNKR